MQKIPYHHSIYFDFRQFYFIIILFSLVIPSGLFGRFEPRDLKTDSSASVGMTKQKSV